MLLIFHRNSQRLNLKGKEPSLSLTNILFDNFINLCVKFSQNLAVNLGIKIKAIQNQRK